MTWNVQQTADKFKEILHGGISVIDIFYINLHNATDTIFPLRHFLPHCNARQTQDCSESCRLSRTILDPIP
eukprot:284815239_3